MSVARLASEQDRPVQHLRAPGWAVPVIGVSAAWLTLLPAVSLAQEPAPIPLQRPITVLEHEAPAGDADDLLPAGGLAQDVGPSPFQGPTAVPEPEAPAGEEEALRPEDGDPRVRAVEAEERRLRIRRQNEFVSEIPTEGSLLRSLNVPDGIATRRGLRYGNFVLLPSVAGGATASDNVNADRNDRERDLSLASSAVFRAQSLLARHQLGFDATFNSGYSVEGDADDYFDWRVGTDGRLDLTRRSRLSGTLGYSRDTEDDSSAEAQGDAADIHDIDGSIGYDLTGNRIDYLIDFNVGRQEFSGNDTGDRDNTTYQISQRVDHRSTSRLTMFVGSEYAYSTYDEDVADDGLGRDAHLVTGAIGADVELQTPITLSAAIGYSQAYFEDSGRDDTGSMVALSTLDWQIDSLTSLELSSSRTLSLTTVDDSSARTDTAVGLALDRQLRADAALRGTLGVVHGDFNDLNRTDYDLLARMEYFLRLTDHFFLNAVYQYRQRLSDDDTAEYYENQALLGFSVAY